MELPGCSEGRTISPEPGPRTAGKQPQVVGDLCQAHGGCVQGAHELDLRVAGGDGLELVRRFAEGDAGRLRQGGGDAARKVGMRVDAGSQGSAADGQLFQARGAAHDQLPRLFHLPGVAGELLAEGHGHGVLQVGPADLQDAGKLRGLAGQAPLEEAHRFDQAVQPDAVGEADHRGDHVVGRLAPVHVIVRVHRLLRAERGAQELVGPVGNHLVRVHVPGGAGTGLEHVDGEVRVPFPLRDFLRGRADRAPRSAAPAGPARRSRRPPPASPVRGRAPGRRGSAGRRRRSSPPRAGSARPSTRRREPSPPPCCRFPACGTCRLLRSPLLSPPRPAIAPACPGCTACPVSRRFMMSSFSCWMVSAGSTPFGQTSEQAPANSQPQTPSMRSSVVQPFLLPLVPAVAVVAIGLARGPGDRRSACSCCSRGRHPRRART